MAELSGNKWVKQFTTFIINTIKEQPGISHDKLMALALMEGVKPETTEKYIDILVKSDMVQYTYHDNILVYKIGD